STASSCSVGSITLMATSRPSGFCTARNTAPCPPCPSGSTISYRPPSTSPARKEVEATMAPRTLYDEVMSEFVLDETVRTSQDGRGVKVLCVDLVVIDGPARGTRVRVEKGSARIGSAPGNDLVLADRAVSRAHCEILVHA